MKLASIITSALVLVASLGSCQSNTSAADGASNINIDNQFLVTADAEDLNAKAGESIAVFAGGCFWCTEASFERIKGVSRVISGYAGGEEQNPTYQQVSAGRTGHTESIQVYYDSTAISYATLVDIFFHAHDPTQLNRQGPDVGKQYRSAIFYQFPYQQIEIEKALLRLQSEYTSAIVTDVKPLQKFWPAEAYHQNYYELHPNDSYIVQVSRPKVIKVEKKYARLLKDKYKKE